MGQRPVRRMPVRRNLARGIRLAWEASPIAFLGTAAVLVVKRADPARRDLDGQAPDRPDRRRDPGRGELRRHGSDRRVARHPDRPAARAPDLFEQPAAALRVEGRAPRDPTVPETGRAGGHGSLRRRELARPHGARPPGRQLAPFPAHLRDDRSRRQRRERRRDARAPREPAPVAGRPRPRLPSLPSIAIQRRINRKLYDWHYGEHAGRSREGVHGDAARRLRHGERDPRVRPRAALHRAARADRHVAVRRVLQAAASREHVGSHHRLDRRRRTRSRLCDSSARVV